MCDMKSIDKIIEYLGPIHELRRWSQKLMAYDLVAVNRPDYMMKDVNALNRGPYHTVIHTYSIIPKELYDQDIKE